MRSGTPHAPRLSPLIAIASALLAREVAAGAPEGAVRLGWARGEGADGCLDERELEERVRARLGRDPFGADGARTIEGSVAVRAGRFAVELRVRDSSGALAGRRQLEVAASDCGKLTEAIVLAVALAIDPRAALGGRTGEPQKASPGEGGDVQASAQPSPSADAAPSPVPVAECPRAPVPACPACPAPACPAPPKDSWLTTRAALRVLGAVGVLPTFAEGMGVRVTLGGSQFQVAAGMSYFPEQETGEFAFGLSTFHAGACGRAGAFGAFSPSLCAEMQAGAMHAVVRELQPLDTGDHFWAALALGPELSFQPLAPLVLEASLLGIIPVRRPRFAVRGESGTVFESRQLGAVASLAVGLSVP